MPSTNRVTYRSSPTKVEKVADVFPASFLPHTVFVRFLQHNNWEHSLLVDFCVSPETCFLLYFTKYLKLLTSTWHDLEATCAAMPWNVSFARPSSSCLNNGVGNERSGAQSVEASADVAPQPNTRVDGHLGCKSGGDVLRARSSSDLVEVSLSHDEVSHDLSRSRCSIAGDTRETRCKHSTGKQQSLVDYPSSDDEVNNCDNNKSDDVIVGSESALDRCASVLYRTNLALERINEQKLIAFNISPLLKLLKTCEYLLENKP